ncbi:sensor domain-containing diguanylate cyclase [Vibrio kasasachensis]|uniref:transporter substrate-binding domain-containing diguanylate cyclase n=1 Tax=Vibrio kasasachensis TaxID=2910248 RepID=UPI003D142151
MVRFLLLALVFLVPFSYAANKNDDVLIIANSKAWKPFSFINDKGEPDGILIDYWKEFSRVTGTRVEFLLVDWKDSLDAVKDGRADLHAGLLWSRERDGYLDYSQPIITIDTQLFINHKRLNVDVSELLAGKHKFTLGAVEGGFEHSYAKDNYPQLTIKTFANNSYMVEAALEGNIDAFIADLQVANFYFHSTKAATQFASVQHLYSGVLRPAVAHNDRILLVQLAKGMIKISNETKNRLFSRWMYIETVYPSYLVPVLVIALLIAVFSYMVILRLAVRSKTRALEKANCELKYLSETDQLTGLSNRYHFYAQFSKRVSNSGTVCVMLFDIDDFKLINDTFGHQVGDVVIQAVGKAVNRITGKKHLIGRIGGEEFAVVCTNTNLEQATKLAECLCESVRELILFEDNKQVTVSLGCAYYHQSSEEISLSEADSLMYQAKAMGKDQFVLEQFQQVPVHPISQVG